MRVLLTRSPKDAARTAQALAAAGHEVLLSPVLDFAAVPHEWPGGVVDAVAATSAQAFTALAGTIGPTAETRRLLPVFVVGGRTADEAARSGFRGETVVAKDAADLASTIADFGPRPRRLVYVAGKDRKQTLELGFHALGIAAETIVVYEARAIHALSPVADRALKHGTVDAVLHYSRRSATLFLEQAQKAGLDAGLALHVCLSPDVAAPLIDAGCGYVRVAQTPDETAVLSILDQA